MEPESKIVLPKSYFNSKSIAFLSVMSALGVVLAFLSVYTLPIGPGVAIDLSHVGTYIVALSGGPILGSIAGAIVGLIPAFRFANPALIPGKILTGFSVGFIYFILNEKITFFKQNNYKKIIGILIAGIVGYIPEMIFTIWDLNIIIGMPEAIVIEILIKAWIEIIVISALMSIIFKNKQISNLISTLIGEREQIRTIEILIFASIIDISMIFLMLFFLPFDFFSHAWGWTWTSQTEFEYFMWIVGLAIILAGIILYIAYDLKIKKKREIN